MKDNNKKNKQSIKTGIDAFKSYFSYPLQK